MSSTMQERYARYNQFTMIPEEVFQDNLQLCKDFAPANGCIVECGVWRGGMAAGMAAMLPDRLIYLFDSFEGLPPVQTIDGPAAVDWQSRVDAPNYYDNCRAERSFAEKAMGTTSARKVEIIQGWFRDTARHFVPEEQIAVLRLDRDWYESTMDCLVGLFQHVMYGGLIIIDDYFVWDGCARAVHDFLSKNGLPDHDFLSKNGLPDRIQQLNGRVCFIRKLGARR